MRLASRAERGRAQSVCESALMKLSAITDEISQDFEHALSVMAEYGVAGAELRGLWGTNIGELSEKQAKRAEQALADAGLVVSCLASPFFKCDLAGSEPATAGRMHLAQARSYGEQLDLLDKLCDLADRFGTRLIRVFSFWRRGPLTPQIEDSIIAAFDEPLAVAERRGVTLCLENEHACYLGTGSEVARVAERIGLPRLAICWDPGNALAAGEVPFPNGYEAVRDRVVHVHVKDAVMPAGAPEWCVVGEGVVDYVGQFSALRDARYEGFISLETHYIPSGGTNEDGSRPSLAALNRLVKGRS